MANHTRVTLEIGPKGKKVVAVAPDWPGLERGAKTGEDAIERLRSYIPRYSQVAKLAEMDAEFDATPTTFHLTQARLTSETSQLLLTATVENYSHPQLQANYVATLDGSQFRKLLQNPALPVGLVRASGSIAYQETANRTLLDTVLLQGDLILADQLLLPNVPLLVQILLFLNVFIEDRRFPCAVLIF